MEILSLSEPVESPTLEVGRSGAVLVSIGFHLLLVLIFLFGPAAATRLLPQSIIAFLSPRPPAAETVPRSAPANASGAAPKQPDPRRIPLKFAYVSVPHDEAIRENPAARLQSDKSRRARQEMPTPADARRLSIDPHSEGTSIDRVKPDPNRPKGREDGEAQSRARRGSPSGGAGSTGTGATARNSSPQGQSTPRPDGLLARGGEPERAPGRQASPGREGTSPGEFGAPEGTAEQGEDPRENLKQALSDLKSGEYKFQFNNPAYLRGGSYGTMSFDTQGFPWGDYARRIYLVIRNNWFARIPLAAENGIRGWVCQRFVIEKDGAISSVQVVRPSGIAPFDRASADALTSSSPLPSLPEDFPEPREGVTFCFYYNMYPGEEGD
jgi:TonB family protein